MNELKENLYPDEVIVIPEQCGNCKHFQEGLESSGFCRKYAPKPYGLNLEKSNALEYFTIWPQVMIDDYCSELEFDKQVLRDAPRRVIGTQLVIG